MFLGHNINLATDKKESYLMCGSQGIDASKNKEQAFSISIFYNHPRGLCALSLFRCISIHPTHSLNITKRFTDRIFQLYEQGADEVRIGEYVRHWLRWVCAGVALQTYAGDCSRAQGEYPPCTPSFFLILFLYPVSKIAITRIINNSYHQINKQKIMALSASNTPYRSAEGL